MVNRQVTAGRHKQHRRVQRSRIGTLRGLIIRPGTETRYNKQLQIFFKWMDSEGLELPDEHIRLDEIVGQYIEYLWECGDPRGWAGDCLSGLSHHLPFVKGNLKGAWRLFQAWQRAELPARATPFTYQTLSGMAGVFLHWGDTRTAVGLLLGYHGILRTGELLNLKKGDMDIDADNGRAVLDLGLTKGGLRQGAVESCIITDGRLVGLAQEVYRDLQPGDPLVPWSGPAFRRMFDQALIKLGLQDQGFKPYSMRRGGATHFYRATANLDALTTRGRWQNSKTARLYVTEAIAELPHLRWSPAQLKELRAYTKVFEDLFV